MQTEHEREAAHIRGFQGRVDRAAAHIASGRPITRSLDNCFENFDGDAVAHALFRRAAHNPDGRLAQNIGDYLCGDACEAAQRDGPHMTLDELRAMSLKNFRDSRAAWARAMAEQEKRNAAYRADMTPEGEQYVIPGCERDSEQGGTKQLDLF
jgi:hypothetical protein